MKKMLGRGWDMTVRHKYVGILLFLYRFLWGFFLFRLVDSVVTPVLARYPDLHPNADAVPLFFIEAEFRLLRTDLLDPLLWLLAGLLLFRMVITPLINAGLYFSFHHTEEEKGSGTRVLAGIRHAWKPVVLLYWLENALVLLPAVWVLPLARERFYSLGSPDRWLLDLLPYAAAWLVWGFAVHLLLRCLQFGAASREGIGKGFKQAWDRALPLLAVSLAMAGIGLAASAAVSSVTVIWSGFIAVVLHQAFHFIRSLLSLWTAASQFAVWRER
ncbi:hypothetical protein GE107_21795 [Cohnella sp. CFH 77786]|uniref:hypothetical protein n=1 Tax=Cohnella sp. CFH 77786 TaxID=2662265 RepID=UPI001C60F4B0|nr:hypothetical protein [Cohnella sp. CFH 77786]MBW5448682.1 hypothetical protein [Cohnella sp. CFH 77786]